MEDPDVRYPASGLRAFASGLFRSCGMALRDAERSAALVVDADLSGVPTHGLANLVEHWHYLPGLESGAVVAAARPTVLRAGAVTAAWDAGRGFGPLVAATAMEDAVRRAGEHGVGMVTVRDGCHFGAAGRIARQAAEAGMIGLVCAPTAPAAVPPGGRGPALGTNPLAVAAPMAPGVPFVLDMAVTAAAGTKVRRARDRGEPVPQGWIVDADGNPTVDPAEYAALCLLGAGADGGGHKGFGLGLAVDILGGVLSGTGAGVVQTFGPQWRIGYWLAAIRIEEFVDRAEYDDRMRGMVDALHAVPPAPGTDGVLLPGERAAHRRAEREGDGVPLHQGVVMACRAAGDRHGVAFPQPCAPRDAGGRD